MDANAPLAASQLDDSFDLLVRLLKLGSFINSPMKDGVCDPLGISQIELKVMMALAGEGALAGHDLVEIMGVPAMNVSRALATLRDKGWIEDAQDPENRRRRPVRLSAAGEQAYARTLPAAQQPVGEDADDAERALVFEAFGGLVDLLQGELHVFQDSNKKRRRRIIV